VKAEAVAAALHGSPQDSDDDHHHHHQTDEQLHFLDRKSLEAAMFDVMVLLAKELLPGLAVLVEP
jgi:hypothetical protein